MTFNLRSKRQKIKPYLKLKMIIVDQKPNIKTFLKHSKKHDNYILHLWLDFVLVYAFKRWERELLNIILMMQT